jgi:hypothetical protein
MKEQIREIDEASDPSTAQERLIELSLSLSLAVKSALTRNPNTPSRVLVSLGMLFPGSFAQNPSVPLFLIEDPDYLRRESALMLRLLRLRRLPDFIWREAARHREQKVRMMLADSRYTPPYLLTALLQDVSAMVRRRALANPMTPKRAREESKKTRTIGDAIAELSENLGYSPHRYDQVQRALETIPQREAIILRMCFGLREDGRPQESVRREAGADVLHEQVRSIDAKALRRLRNSAALRQFLDDW